jgi:hypothetical protein
MAAAAVFLEDRFAVDCDAGVVRGERTASADRQQRKAGKHFPST